MILSDKTKENELSAKRKNKTYIDHVFDDYPLDPYEFRVFARLSRREGKEGKAKESVPNMAKRIKISESKLKQCLRILEALGMIKREEVVGKPTLYETVDAVGKWVKPEKYNLVRKATLESKFKRAQPRDSVDPPRHLMSAHTPTPHVAHPDTSCRPTPTPHVAKGLQIEGLQEKVMDKLNTQLINATENDSANTRAKPDLEKPNQSINAHESFAFGASVPANVNDDLVKDDFNEKSITPPEQKSDAAIKAFQSVSFNFAQTAISTLESKYKMSPADALARWGETGIKDAFLDAAEVMKQSTSRIPYRWADILAHAATAKTAKTISEKPVNPNAESKVDYYEGYEVRSSYAIALDGNRATPYRLEVIWTRGSKLSRLSFLALDDQSHLTLIPSDIESGSVHVSSLS